MKKIKGSTQMKLYRQDNTLIKKSYFADIIGYLYNRHLIELPNEYFVEDDNGWKSTYYYNYYKIFRDFEKLTNNEYKIEKLEGKDETNL